jgi:hypothetical protein
MQPKAQLRYPPHRWYVAAPSNNSIQQATHPLAPLPLSAVLLPVTLFAVGGAVVSASGWTCSLQSTPTEH